MKSFSASCVISIVLINFLDAYEKKYVLDVTAAVCYLLLSAAEGKLCISTVPQHTEVILKTESNTL